MKRKFNWSAFWAIVAILSLALPSINAFAKALKPVKYSVDQVVVCGETSADKFQFTGEKEASGQFKFEHTLTEEDVADLMGVKSGKGQKAIQNEICASNVPADYTHKPSFVPSFTPTLTFTTTSTETQPPTFTSTSTEPVDNGTPVDPNATSEGIPPTVEIDPTIIPDSTEVPSYTSTAAPPPTDPPPSTPVPTYVNVNSDTANNCTLAQVIAKNKNCVVATPGQ